MMVSILLRAALVVTGLVCVSCRLEGQSGDIGSPCNDATDCTDRDHGCVPIDDTKPNGSRVCMPPAQEWTCEGKLFGDAVCDCGCGFQDVDCPDLNATSCAADIGNNCPGGQNPVPNDNTRCS